MINSFDVTNKDTALGQIDINLIAVDNSLYDVWGMVNDYPSNLIGECKNYSSEKVSRPEIEKTCWRSAKGKALSFFIGNGYKETAISEIGEFNLYKNQIINNGNGVYIVPISISMLEVVIDNNLNFCYFIKWAIKASKMMAIANYL
ncbi:hypothetical protein B9G53_15525 [Pseudanabaena sp. SR411]|uniref:hypothetical protein n=1 Tax=Pseudanabaena sp. SR411 TaxID=1980935 RepID=UPI000B993F8B|nr:hypothetical protein [Pseudanabaena sp. SR411]OYQ63722.1 hypothetical protein B9G53_15525 [Pseudanabaena sp. SR411]